MLWLIALVIILILLLSVLESIVGSIVSVIITILIAIWIIRNRHSIINFIEAILPLFIWGGIGIVIVVLFVRAIIDLFI